MNSIKRLFILPFLLSCLIATSHAIYTFFTADTFSLAWVSVLVSCGVMLGFMMYLGAAGVGSTSRNMPIQLTSAVVGALIAVTYFELLPSLYTLIIGFAGVFVYVFWYSNLSRQDSPVLESGKQLPEFELLDDKGLTIRSSNFIGSPTIFLFYRGSWCPLCVAQVKDISQQYQDLKARGVEAVMISPQGQADTKKVAKKFNTPFTFGFDKDGNAAKQLGILHDNGIPPGMGGSAGSDTVMPTVIITDSTGKIIWTHQTDNYRVRPEPETFIEILDAHFGKPGSDKAKTGNITDNSFEPATH